MVLFYEKQIQKVAVNHSLNYSSFILSNKSMSEQIADGTCMVSRRSADSRSFKYVQQKLIANPWVFILQMLGLRTVAMNKSANLKGCRNVQRTQWSLNYLQPLYRIRALKNKTGLLFAFYQQLGQMMPVITKRRNVALSPWLKNTLTHIQR